MALTPSMAKKEAEGSTELEPPAQLHPPRSLSGSGLPRLPQAQDISVGSVTSDNSLTHPKEASFAQGESIL